MTVFLVLKIQKNAYYHKILLFHVNVNKDIMIYLSSKDVIHSFGIPEMRIKQDAIPGMTIPFFFTPTMTSNELLTYP